MEIHFPFAMNLPWSFHQGPTCGPDNAEFEGGGVARQCGPTTHPCNCHRWVAIGKFWGSKSAVRAIHGHPAAQVPSLLNWMEMGIAWDSAIDTSVSWTTESSVLGQPL